MRTLRPTVIVPLLVALVAALAIFALGLGTSKAVAQVVTEVAIDTNVDDNGDQGEDGTQKAPGTNECYDNVDNGDGDGLIDGADPDCQTGLYLDNDDTTVSAADFCVSVAVGQSVVVDLWVQGVDPADLISAYQYDIDYNNAAIDIGYDDDGDTLADEDRIDGIDNDGDTLTDEDPQDYIDVDGTPSSALLPPIMPDGDISILSRIDSSGGAGFIEVSDTVTNPSSVTFVAADGTIAPAPPANREAGDGVLARFVVTGVAAGVSSLTIPSVLGGADANPDSGVYGGTGPLDGLPIPITTQTSGLVAVGQPCPLPADLKITQVHTAPTDMDVSATENFEVIKTIHNNGPDANVNAQVTSS
ncbi:unnamed protein product, partial [marine sediment metagenome]